MNKRRQRRMILVAAVTFVVLPIILLFASWRFYTTVGILPWDWPRMAQYLKLSRTNPIETEDGPARRGPRARVRLETLLTGIDNPTTMTLSPGGEVFYILQKRGDILKMTPEGDLLDGEYVDLSDRIEAGGTEQGLFSMVFEPGFEGEGYVFISYSDLNGDVIVSRFEANLDSLDPDSELIILKVDQFEADHNGGSLIFGPDGYLYAGFGDGGGFGDPHQQGQDMQSLRSTLVRIDVSNASEDEPYTIPPDNPFIDDPEGADEIWAYGLRNPWRLAWEPDTEDLFIGDVGQYLFEEIDVIPAGEGGLNYGWSAMEGLECYEGTECDPTQYVKPLVTYNHTEGCSITGGYFYRGEAIKDIQGMYVFGDYCQGRIWGLLRDDNGRVQVTELLGRNDTFISAFAEDADGELYVVNLIEGEILKVVGN